MSKVGKKRAAKISEEDEEVKTSTTTKKRVLKAASKTGDADAADVKLVGSGAIPVMLAHNFDPDRDDPSGWLMSEKMDGVRCYWNGSTMYTRTGKLFYAP